MIVSVKMFVVFCWRMFIFDPCFNPTNYVDF